MAPTQTMLTCTAGRGSPLRVLVVDDNYLLRELAVELLQDIGVRAMQASDGAEAVRLVTDGHPFDLVLMDINMPVLDGLTATALIRDIERERARTEVNRLTIVALTSEVMPSDRSVLQHLGLDEVLPKPILPAALLACLNRWCPGAVRPS